MGRGLIIILIVSLAVNVFAGGFIAGRLLSGDRPPGPPIETADAIGGDGPRRMMQFAETLPPPAREAFRSKIRSQLPALRQQQRALRRLRNEMRELVAADEWDRQAIDALAAEMSAAQGRQWSSVYSSYIEAIESLPKEERQRFMAMENQRYLERQKRQRERRRPN